MKYALAFFLIVILTVVGLAWGTYHYLTPAEPDPRIASPGSVRVIAEGEIIGYQGNNDVHAWVGIPYALPPVGEHRWQPPRSPEAWDGRREMLEYGSRCVQMSVLEPDRAEPIGSEDCLYLNVWAPLFAAEKVPTGSDALPVMVWIHGGGNSMGEAATSIYDGSLMAVEHDVIVVSVNYRLGMLGWFRHPALGSDPLIRSGNFGTLDLIAALQWVQDNIAVFGGDPDNVTIYGESAGGANVLSLLASPLASGLFHRAISQSGGLFMSSVDRATNYRDAPVPGHPLSARELVNEWLVAEGKARDRDAARGVQDAMEDRDLAVWLREREPADLYAPFAGKAMGGIIDTPALFTDGTVIPAVGDPLDIFRSGNYNQVPVILGTNRDEVKLFAMFAPDVLTRLGPLPTGIRDLAAYNRDTGYSNRLWKAEGADELAEVLSAAQSEPVFVYRFDVDDWRNLGLVDLKDLLGAAHAMELFFVFGNFPEPMRLVFPESMKTEFDLVSTTMMAYWSAFAADGKPGNGRHGEQLTWLPWREGGQMIFDTTTDAGTRMNDDRESVADIRSEFLADRSYADRAARCAAYRTIFRENLYDDAEYAELGCSD